jgi:Uma2 family endonuclease
MAIKTLLTIEQYAALDEPAGFRHELCAGELIVTPSANYFHNNIRDRFNARLRGYLDAHPCGNVVSEMDMTLGPDTVRRPDITFVRKGRLEGIDLEQVPLPIAPDLAIEIVSKNDRADDLNLKVSQYLQAGVHAVWLFYPITRLAYRYVPGRLNPEVHSAEAGDRFEEPELLSGFALPLSEIFN